MIFPKDIDTLNKGFKIRFICCNPKN